MLVEGKEEVGNIMRHQEEEGLVASAYRAEAKLVASAEGRGMADNISIGQRMSTGCWRASRMKTRSTMSWEDADLS